MIAKISATENLGGALGYNFKKVRHNEASVLCVNELRECFDGTYRMDKVLADMLALIPEKCRTKKTVFHCSLNPHPDEQLSDETLSQIAKEYMEALGYGKQPYIVFKHNDIAREHIHIVSLRIDGNGKKVNDKFEGKRSKLITDDLERKYNLIPSSKVGEKEVTETPKVDTSKGNIKEQVASVVRMVLKHYRFCSLGELNAILRKYNLAIEEVKTEFRGKKYDGLVYIPTDDKSNNKVSIPIHASDIGRGVGYIAVQNRIQKSKQSIKPLIPAVREKVLHVMRTSPQTEEALRQRLEEQGLRVVIRRNDNGRLYGITFIDDEGGIALNGSRLGKGYVANAFNAYFANPNHNPFLDETLYGNPSLRSEQTNVSLPMQPNIEESDNIVDELIEELVGEPFAPTGNDDWKEAAWQRKLRRQNKIRLKRRKR
ncbi:conjugal transfer protein MobB [Porphyromonas loveana]|uniref:Relaxase/mobilization nuclease-like protein n=1 Tax=Porphyromonas loveana TaxID=1884669 RepID=A0A2U1FMF7_9PORP|nr:conjugal transfer protein MobB [Porphyromonas loveana]PVZ13344.1 relaxase/mobilization nuclease-like protein [Porphyromonas loveana]